MKTTVVLILLIKIVLSQLIGTLTNKENLIVTYTISNPTQNTIKLLTWGTPFDEMQKDMFKMVEAVSGTKSIYDGKIVMRATPLESNYLTFSPFEKKSIDINLSKHYLFPEKGVYNVQIVDTVSPLITTKSSLITIKVSEEVAIIDKLSLTTPENSISKNEKQVIRRINCNIASDNTHIDRGVQGGQKEANCSFNCLRANSCDNIAIKWFGVKNTARYERATTVWKNVATALTQNFGVHCRHKECTPAYYGWVYSNDRDRIIYLCPLYFSSSYYGSMFTHEISHFNAVSNPGTDDHAYGRSACETLARSNPAKSVENADTYSYFGEDCLKK